MSGSFLNIEIRFALVLTVLCMGIVFCLSAEGAESDKVSFSPVKEVPDTFLLGIDVSELLSEEASGVIYHGEDGSEQDVFDVLAGYGVNCVRIRVWNDPYDEEGHGYGGGNTDTKAAAEMGRRTAERGIRTLVDFHYSDFWADPARQLIPKAWEGMNLSEKTDALYDFTKTALEEILDAGTDVSFVQVGNEISNGMAGETDYAEVTDLLKAGVRAVRDVASARGISIEPVLHLTDIQDYAKIEGWLSAYEEAGIDYSYLGLSYYPYWHGSLDYLGEVIRNIRDNYGKNVFIAETAYPFTLDDGDASGNIIVNEDSLTEGYPASPGGQVHMLRDICETSVLAGAAGVFYWGGLWIPVGNDYETNIRLWEKYGSGWASSYSAAYDPVNVGDYWGGCAWDNQALFDFNGYPLPAMNVFRYLAAGYGVYENAEDTGNPEADFTDETENEEDGSAKMNLLLNPGFEENDYSMWEAVSLTGEYPLDYQDFVNDAHSGTIAFHFWSEQDMEFYIEQTVTGLEPGTYRASVCAQGGDMNDSALMVFYVNTDGKRYDQEFRVTSWADWQYPEITGITAQSGVITIGAYVRCNALAWGTFDDFCLEKIE